MLTYNITNLNRLQERVRTFSLIWYSCLNYHVLQKKKKREREEKNGVPKKYAMICNLFNFSLTSIKVMVHGVRLYQTPYSFPHLYGVFLTISVEKLDTNAHIIILFSIPHLSISVLIRLPEILILVIPATRIHAQKPISNLQTVIFFEHKTN